MLNICIVEDNPTQLMYYEIYLKEYLKQEVITLRTFGDPKLLLFDTEWLQDLDLILMDIHFETENGIDLARKLKQLYPQIVVIFISAYIEYAPQVYDVEHVYFVLKQQVDYRLPKALDAAISKIKEAKQNYIQIHWKNSIYNVPLQDILYVERSLRKCKFITMDETYDMYIKMEDVLKLIQKQNFIRAHYSYIINIAQVKQFHRTHVIMNNNECITISRPYEKAVKAAILHDLDTSIV